jgi:hypothetical protein
MKLLHSRLEIRFSVEKGLGSSHFGLAIGWNNNNKYTDYMLLLPFSLLILTYYKSPKTPYKR